MSQIPETTMKPLLWTKRIGAAAAASAAAVLLSSCATPSEQSSTSAEPSSPASTASQAGGEYKDGTYHSDGNYTSPNGQEKIGVELELKDGKVTALDLTSYPTNPNTQKFQGQFIGGINEQVVGKSLDEIAVDKVAGSSLTGKGFTAAIDAIKAEAAE